MSIANAIADRYGNDGSSFEDANGERIEDAAGERAMGAFFGHDYRVFRYRDGSALVVADEGWDVLESVDADGSEDFRGFAGRMEDSSGAVWAYEDEDGYLYGYRTLDILR